MCTMRNIQRCRASVMFVARLELPASGHADVARAARSGRPRRRAPARSRSAGRASFGRRARRRGQSRPGCRRSRHGAGGARSVARVVPSASDLRASVPDLTPPRIHARNNRPASHARERAFGHPSRLPSPARHTSTSAAVGMLGCAPSRVTEHVAASTACCSALSSPAPPASATAKAALNTSPAAVVSTARTGRAAAWRTPRRPISTAPDPPSLASTAAAPRALIRARPAQWPAPRSSPAPPAASGSRPDERPQLGLVRRHVVDQPQQLVGYRPRRRRIEQNRAARGPRPPRHGHHGLERDLELEQHHARAGERLADTSTHVAASRCRWPRGRRRCCSRRAVHDDQRDAGGRRRVGHDRRRRPRHRPRGAPSPGALRILPDARHQRDRRAETRRGKRLVRTLTAGVGRKPRARDRLARPRRVCSRTRRSRRSRCRRRQSCRSPDFGAFDYEIRRSATAPAVECHGGHDHRAGDQALGRLLRSHLRQARGRARR